MAFECDPGRGRVASITYLTGTDANADGAQKQLLALWNAPEAKGLNVQIREIAPGVALASYSLMGWESTNFFFFALDAMLGHAVYV